jgi:hypothetical protein
MWLAGVVGVWALVNIISCCQWHPLPCMISQLLAAQLLLLYTIGFGLSISLLLLYLFGDKKLLVNHLPISISKVP